MKGRSSKGTEKRIQEEFVSNGYDIVDCDIIGVDPGSGATRALVVARFASVKTMYGYNVYDVMDYTQAKDRSTRSYGMAVELVYDKVSREEALRYSAERFRVLMTDYSWLIPGTNELVPGCWGDE